MAGSDDAPSRSDLPNVLFDLLAERLEAGRDIYEMAETTKFPVRTVRAAIHDLRLILAEDDTLFVTCEPQGSREAWKYRLVDGQALMDAERNLPWVANRLGDMQTRITIMEGAAKVAVRATDGRTREHKKAVAIEMGLRHIREQLTVLDSE